MSLDKRENKLKKGRRKKSVRKDLSFGLLKEFFKDEKLARTVEKDVDAIVSKYWSVPPSRRKYLQTYIRMKHSELERNETLTKKEKEEERSVLKELMKKTMRFKPKKDTKKEKTFLDRQVGMPEGADRIPEEPDVPASIKGLPKGEGPDGFLVLHADDVKRYRTHAELKEVARAVYPDERIYWKYLKRLSVNEKDKLRLLLQRRGLDKYLKVSKDKVKKEIDAALDAKKYAEKSHKTEELLTLHKLLILKTKYLADSHTEKDWLKLWGPAYDEHRAGINMDLIDMKEWRKRYGHLLRK